MRKLVAEFRNDGTLLSAGEFGGVAVDDHLVWYRGYVSGATQVCIELGGGDDWPDATAASLALGFRKWGVEVGKHLRGEFAAVVYDRGRREVLLVQDALAIIPLYYRTGGAAFHAASHIEDLSSHLGDRGLDEEYLADYLCYGDHRGERTPFKSIRQLTPGVAIRYKEGKLSRHFHWALERRQQVACKDTREYAERMRELVTEGVKAALPKSGRSFCEVSGGLDSSTVACVAAREGSPSNLQALSYVYSKSRTADESHLSRLVVERFGLTWHRLDVDAMRPFSKLPSWRGQPHHTMVNAALTAAYDAVLRENQVTTVLSGAGGDGVLYGDGPEPFYLADLLSRGKLFTMCRELVRWATETRQPRPARYWWNRCVVKAAVGRRRGCLIQDHPPAVPWLSETYERGAVRSGLPRDTWVPSSDGVADAWFLERVLRSAGVVALRDAAGPMSAEFRYPLMYLPLVQFMRELPWALTFSPTHDRLLQRQAFVGVVPEPILDRRSKGDPSQATYSGLETGEWWRAIRSGKRLIERGYVDGNQWSRTVDLARLGRCESIMHFKAAATLEVWLQQHSHSPSSPEPS